MQLRWLTLLIITTYQTTIRQTFVTFAERKHQKIKCIVQVLVLLMTQNYKPLNAMGLFTYFARPGTPGPNVKEMLKFC